MSEKSARSNYTKKFKQDAVKLVARSMAAVVGRLTGGSGLPKQTCYAGCVSIVRSGIRKGLASFAWSWKRKIVD